MRIRATIILLVLGLSVACTSKKGRINLRTDPPSAEVYVQGNKIGETPIGFDYDYRTLSNLEILKDGYYPVSEVLSRAWIMNEYRRGNYKEAIVMMDGKNRKAWVVDIHRKLIKQRGVAYRSPRNISKTETPTTGQRIVENAQLAVMDLKAKYGVDTELAEGLSVVVRDTIQAFGRHEVLSKDDVEIIAKRTAIRQILGCDDTKCLIDIGRSLGTEFMVAGALSKFGDTYNVSLRLIDTVGDDAGVKKRVNRSCRCTEDELIEAARAVASLLIE